MSAPVSPLIEGIAAVDQQSQRQTQMRRAYQSYVGRPKKPLWVRIGEPDDNLLLCFARLVVDKGVSFLFGQDVASQVTDTLGASTRTERDLAKQKTAPRQDWLDECWRRNKRAILLQKWATNGGIFGHAFLRLLDTKPWPRVIVLDPQLVDVDTDPDDIDTVWRYTIAQPPQVPAEGEPPTRRRTIIQAEVAEGRITAYAGEPGWSITDQVFSGGAWVNSASVRWPHPFSPIVDCQNLPKPNDFWGESDLPEDVLAVLDAINRVATHYNKIIRLHAHPKIWTRGMGARTLDVGIDSVIHLPAETAELRALEMQSDLSSTKALLDELLQALGMMVRIPLVAMGVAESMAADPSGIALQIRYQPLLEKTHTKRNTYGDALVEADRRLLALGGWGDTTITELQWHEMLPVDPLMERQVLVLDDSLGVASKQTIAKKLAYDYDAEQENLKEEAAAGAARAQAAGLPAPGQQVPGETPASAPPTTGQPVPPPAPFSPPKPDVAMTARSR